MARCLATTSSLTYLCPCSCGVSQQSPGEQNRTERSLLGGRTTRMRLLASTTNQVFVVIVTIVQRK